MTGSLNGPPRRGDLVAVARGQRIKLTLTDRLLGDEGGLRPQTRGVVVATNGWSKLNVKFDTGFGTVTARVSARHVRIIQRGYSVERFDARVRTLTQIRLGVLLATVIVPMTWFFFATGASFDSFIPALATATLDGSFGLLDFLVTEPARAAVFIAVAWVLKRLALGQV